MKQINQVLTFCIKVYSTLSPMLQPGLLIFDLLRNVLSAPKFLVTLTFSCSAEMGLVGGESLGQIMERGSVFLVTLTFS